MAGPRLIVDGNGLACRLWWARQHRAPERFTETVQYLRDQLECQLVIVAWDAAGPSWRREVMPAYKANRKPKPLALVEAIAACRWTPFDHVEAPGFEADDIIGTLVREAPVRPTFILCSDKDLMQLVGDGCGIVGVDGKVVGPREVFARWKVTPSRMQHLISWMGDAADGMPGVPGVGPVKGAKMAMQGKVGDVLTFHMAQLATVPARRMAHWRGQGAQDPVAVRQ